MTPLMAPKHVPTVIVTIHVANSGFMTFWQQILRFDRACFGM
jgi:hypothetical protein